MNYLKKADESSILIQNEKIIIIKQLLLQTLNGSAHYNYFESELTLKKKKKKQADSQKKTI